MQVWIDLSQVICRRKLSGIPRSSGKLWKAQAGGRDADRGADGDFEGDNKRILSFYHYLFLFVCICMCSYTCVLAHVGRSDLQESVLSFHLVGPGVRTHIVSSGLAARIFIH